MSQLSKRIPELSAIAAFLGLIFEFWKNLSAELGLSSAVFRFVLIGLLLIFLLLIAKRRLLARSRIVKPELLPTSVRDEAQLLERDQDVTDLFAVCTQFTEIHLVGESGVGKTALIKVGLAAKIAQTPTLRFIYMDTWGDDWVEGPQDALGTAVWGALTAEERGVVGLGRSPDSETTFTTIRKVKQELGMTLLLVFDQFDDYLIRHRSQLISTKNRTWLSARELVLSNRFWRKLAASIQDESVRVMFVTRAGEADALNVVRFGPPEVYRLFRLNNAFLRPLLERLTNGGLVDDPEAGWRALMDRLIEDLSEDGWVLPVQMRLVFRGLSSLPAPILAEYFKIGGIRGIEASVVEQQIAAAQIQFGLPKSFSLRALLLFVDREHMKGIPRREEDLASVLSAKGRPFPQTGELLHAWIGSEILRPQLQPGSEALQYTLYHDYLCRGILEVERRQSRFLTLLREQQRRHRDAHGFWQRWRELLSPAEFLLVVGRRMAGGPRLGSLRGYVVASSLRLAFPLILISMLVVGAADAGLDFPGAQRLRDTIDGVSLSLLRRIYSRQELAERAARVRTALLEELLERRSANGFPTTQVPSDARDYWTTGQALCASMAAPENHAKARALVDSVMAPLFEGLVFEDQEPAGWAVDDLANYSRSEPVFWAGCAVARAQALGVNDPRLRQWAGSVMAAARRFRGVAPGSWDIVSDPIGSRSASAYESALALLMILERKDGAAGGGDFTRQDRELATMTVEWLISQRYRDPVNGVVGWTDGVAEYRVVPGLTYQIIATLLRAERELDVELPAPVLASAKELLQSPPSFAVGDQRTIRLVRTFREFDGHTSRCGLDLSILIYPWALNAGAEWLRRDERLGNLEGDPLVRRTLSVLLADEKAIVAAARPAYTFHIAELVYGLSPFDGLSSQAVDKQH